MSQAKRYTFRILALLILSLTPVKTVTHIQPSYTNNNTPLIACDCDFCVDIKAKRIAPECNSAKTRSEKNKKQYTVIVYMAADNDLRQFAARNLNQMAAIGSNEFIDIVVHLDIKVVGNKKITRRYHIEKNSIVHLNPDDAETQSMDSGDPKTLYSCCQHFITDFEADEYMLILWNHGTGALDPIKARHIINPSEFFVFNPITKKYDLDRSIGFFEHIEPSMRGICWDHSTGNFLSNSTLDTILDEIQKNILKGKKFAIIGFDACLMEMIEIASIIKKYAYIMVGSQEVELGTGWNYTSVFAPLEKRNLSPVEFANHIVQSYKEAYTSITNDFSCSAINLELVEELEEMMNVIALFLIECIKRQKDDSVVNTIRACRSRISCTHFDEPSYIDLANFLSNLHQNLNRFSLYNTTPQLLADFSTHLQKTLRIISNAVFANVVGKNLQRAQGISIYFPEKEKRIHPSYYTSPFAETNRWINFLATYIKA